MLNCLQKALSQKVKVNQELFLEEAIVEILKKPMSMRSDQDYRVIKTKLM